MKNVYDTTEFFTAYQKMPRSSGLRFAGEWQQMQKLMPDAQGKDVLDLGCGMGWHCAYFAEHGARSVLGIDGSENMLRRAREMHAANGISYRLCDLLEYDYPESAFDIVFSNLALHYIEDLTDIYQRVHRSMRRGGTFLFNIEHPTFTAGVKQEWITDADGKILYWPVDNYYYAGIRETDFLGFPVQKYHHTLTQIVNPLLQTGFVLTALEEVVPPGNMMDVPGMQDEMRRPMMLLVKAVSV